MGSRFTYFAGLELASAITSSADPWGTFVAALNSAMPGLGSFVDFVVNNAMSIFAAIGAMILAVVVPALSTLATSLTTIAIPAAIATITAMAPMIAIVAAIGLAVGLLVAAWTNNWFGIQEIVASVWAYLSTTFNEVYAWLLFVRLSGPLVSRLLVSRLRRVFGVTRNASLAKFFKALNNGDQCVPALGG